MSGHTITTDSGIAFDFDAPTPDMVSIEDIATALSNVCRFGGHVNQNYSVAQHAVSVRDIVRRMGHPELGYAALHHDSHEAYTGDIPTPLKRMLQPAYDEIVKRVDLAIWEALNIPTIGQDGWRIIALADEHALNVEGVQLKSGPGAHRFAQIQEIELGGTPLISPLTHKSAEREFLAAHDEEVRVRREPQYA